MLGEVGVFGALVPTLLVRFLITVGLFVPADWIVTRCGFYNLTWHPSLARFGLFLILFSGLSLLS